MSGAEVEPMGADNRSPWDKCRDGDITVEEFTATMEAEGDAMAVQDIERRVRIIRQEEQEARGRSLGGRILNLIRHGL